MKYLFSTLCMFLCVLAINAQELNLLPQLLPAGGSYEDKVIVTCTFPEGCAGGKYWFNGGQVQAKSYEGPIRIENTTRLSVAGVNAEGRIITDVVTQDYTINKVTPAYVTTTPELNTARESFYATTIQWNNVVTSALDVSDFKDGGSRAGQPALWLVYEPTKEVIATNTHGGLWLSATNTFKAYIYKNYRPTAEGAYTLHIAGGVFIIDGKRYEDELVLKYFVGQDEQTAPIFTPASGTYEGKVQVSISYPQNAFYQFYQIEGQNRKNYDGPFTITESCKIKAWGRNEDYSEETESTTAEYTVLPTAQPKDELPKPTFSRAGNTIHINETAPNIVIKYWVDNHMQNARLYQDPITVDRNCLISAVAYSADGLSPTVDYEVSWFEENDVDHGILMTRTPEQWENINLTSISPNGRFVSGFTDAGGSPRAFVWDITSGKGEYITPQYLARATGVSNDGTICGWKVDTNSVTGETTSTSEDDLFYGYCQNGVWTRQPNGMTVMGITGDNVLYGSYDKRPCTYDIATETKTVYPGAYGCLNCISADGKTFGGWVSQGGKQTAAYWKDGSTTPTTIQTDRECAVTSISGNGQWMLLDNASWGAYYDIAGYRYSVAQQKLETLTSMGARYPSRYEWMHSVADDGTLYGVYDATLQSHDAGRGLVYTTDGVWRDVKDVLTERGVKLDDLTILSSKYVTANQNTIVMSVFPSDMGVDDGFHYALAVHFDAQTGHAAPTSAKAEQMFGLKTVKVSWEAPVTGAEDVASYKVYRNGQLLTTVAADQSGYYDNDIVNHTTYTYSVSALYNDGVESELSYPTTLTVELQGYMPARELALRQSGINDVNLTWQAPVISLPKLQYFDETSEFAAFGTSGYDSEWAIRLSATDVSVYEGFQIRTFQFLPTGAQESFELRLYEGTAGNTRCASTPFYTQSIDPAALKYGTVNTIKLDEPQNLPVGKDLYVALYIHQKGNDNMLGVSHDGFRAGYTDLCKVIGVHDAFVSISESSSTTTEIVVPLGVGLGTDETLKAAMVANYEVSDNGVVLGSTELMSFRQEDVSEGQHTFSVRTQYQDGVYSEPVTLKANIQKNEAAFVPVDDLSVESDAAKNVSFSWSAPLNDDRTNIHWGDMTPTEGLPNMGYPVYSVGAIYPVTMTNAYADAYEITHLFYYPTADASFRLFLDDNVSTVLYDETMTAKVGELNIVPLTEPITVDASINYRFVIDVNDCPYGEAPIAFDSTNKCADGYSNMINAGNDWMTLDQVLQINQHPNWLMGMIIRQKDAREMPLLGYNVVVDNVQLNEHLLTDCLFTANTIAEGNHQATVDVVYDQQRTVKGVPVSFSVGTTGIFGVAEGSATTLAYDLQGRRVIADKLGRGLYIINNKKIIR